MDRDDSLDYVKGCCVVSFLLTSFFCWFLGLSRFDIWQPLWGSWYTPLFLFITCWIVFDKYEKSAAGGLPLGSPAARSYFSFFKLRFKSAFGRIYSRFIFVVFLIYFISLLLGMKPLTLSVFLLVNGGWGPDSWFPYVHFQFLCFLPLFLYITSRWRLFPYVCFGLSFILDGLLFWLFPSYSAFHHYSFLRYLAIPSIAWFFYHNSSSQSFRVFSLILGLLSFILLFFANYSSSYIPILFGDGNFLGSSSIFYFYPIFILFPFFRWLYRLNPNSYSANFLVSFGRCSWGISLFFMFLFYFLVFFRWLEISPNLFSY